MQETRPDGPASAENAAAETGGPPAVAVLGDFLLEKEIARGASGVVWRAWDRKLEREVAVKIMREASLAGAHAQARFRAEAAATAALVHPHLVRLYGAGEEEGVLFLAMEFVDGPDLARLAARGPLPAREAARHLAAAAEGVQCAHDSGVIHRDLKPSNLLLGADQQIRVADFGIARRESGDLLTLTGDTLGTPGYMAPEQAAGQAATPRSDIYGLGATLYHLLTGRAPFAGESHLAVLQQMTSADPVPPRVLNPGVPRDLETICLKALACEPARRYGTARELAEDLRRFLAGETVRARPTGPVERAWRWCRRRPALALSLAGMAALGTAVVATSVISAARIEGLRKDAVARLYASDMRLACQGLAEGRLGLAESLLERHRPTPGGEDQRGFEWYHLQEVCRGGGETTLAGMRGAVDAIAVSDDGRWLAAGAENLRLWSLPDGKPHDAPLSASSALGPVRSLVFAPGGGLLAVTHAGGALRILSPSTGEIAASADCGVPGPVAGWEPDGAHLSLVASHTRWLWLWRDGQDGLARQEDFPLAAHRPVFSGDAGTLAFSTVKGWDISIFDLRQHTAPHTIPGAHDIACSLAFTDDGGILAIGHFSGAVSMFERPFLQPQRQTLTHRGKVDLMAFSRDGTRLASASNEVIVLQTPGDSQPRQTLLGHRHTVRSLAFSPDGQKLVSGDAGGVVKVWDVALRTDHAQANAISQDGATILHNAGPDVIEVERTSQPPVRFRVAQELSGTRVPSVCGVWREGCVLSGENPVCVLFDGSVVERSLPENCLVVGCSPDGRWIYLVRPPLNTPVIWDRLNRREHLVLEPDPPNPTAATFSPDSRYCASGFRSGLVKVHDLETAREIQRIEAHSAWAYQRAFSQDGTLLATAGFDGVVRVWDWRSGTKLREFTSTSVSDGFWSVALSPDGRRLAAGTGESTVALWDFDTGLETALFQAMLPPQTIENLRFTSDGNALYVHGLLLRAPRNHPDKLP